jgi:hypothetical protein
MSEEYRGEMSKPSYAQLIILSVPAAFLVAYLGVGPLARLVDLEQPLWLKICWSVYVATMLHATTVGLLGTLWLKVPIERIAFGFGKRWLQTNIATVPISFGVFFFNSWVKFADNEPQLYGWRRCVLELSGCAVLLALSALIMGRHATFDVFAFWRQSIEGALSPFGHAQVLLFDLGHYLAGLDELSIMAAVFFGQVSISLLPLPPLPGGNALMYFFSSTLYPLTERSQEWLFRVGFLTLVFGCGSWLLALLFLAYNSWVRTSFHSLLQSVPA